jgi:hypothetical protein
MNNKNPLIFQTLILMRETIRIEHAVAAAAKESRRRRDLARGQEISRIIFPSTTCQERTDSNS